MTTNAFHTSLIERSLDLAAGTAVNMDAYQKWGINLAKLQCLGKGFRQGWLHNVLLRITPLTAHQIDDYVMMADMLIQTKSEANQLLGHLSKSLSHFATVAGINPHDFNPYAQRPTQLLANHIELYNRVAKVLEERFNIQAPAAFSSTVIHASTSTEEVAFIRQFIRNQQARVA